MESIKQLVQRVNRSFTNSNLNADELDELVEEIEDWMKTNVTNKEEITINKTNIPDYQRPEVVMDEYTIKLIEFGLTNPNSIDKELNNSNTEEDDRN